MTSVLVHADRETRSLFLAKNLTGSSNSAVLESRFDQEPAPSQMIKFRCEKDHVDLCRFGADVDPYTLDVQQNCSTCGRVNKPAVQLETPVQAPPAGRAAKMSDAAKAHLERVRERRSDAELNELLNEALTRLRNAA